VKKIRALTEEDEKKESHKREPQRRKGGNFKVRSKI